MKTVCLAFWLSLSLSVQISCAALSPAGEHVSSVVWNRASDYCRQLEADHNPKVYCLLFPGQYDYLIFFYSELEEVYDLKGFYRIGAYFLRHGGYVQLNDQFTGDVLFCSLQNNQMACSKPSDGSSEPKIET